ncbi:hypothetical protein [Embleya sp. NPDC005971]|uniref:hypothetical protein n=1 Tax=Embleya sp. NPDC005971 TaxID=3156724 RepID=UPI0033E99BAA
MADLDVDTGPALITWAYLTKGAFGDLVREYTDPVDQQNLLIEASREAEAETGHRLIPFTGLIETQPAYGIDPDEMSGSDNLPLDLAGSLGRSWANAVGGGMSSLVRRIHLDQYASKYAEKWAYSDVSVRVVRSYGGSQDVTAQILMGPNPDTGFLWFQLGTWLPIGSEFQITYSGGYFSVPGDLARAVKFLAAANVVAELDPMRSNGHEPDVLRSEARRILTGYVKD